MKLLNLFKKKNQSEKHLFKQAEELMHNHFKKEFGDEIKVSFSITEAKKQSEYQSDSVLIMDSSKFESIHHVHYKK